MTATRREVIRGGVLLAAAGAMTKFARAQAISPSPEWSRAMPSAPVAGTKITEAYAALVARDAFLWGWPLVNVYNRRLTYAKVPDVVMAGPVPAAPLNRLGMLSNYIVPEERIVACPNQDVVYGAGALALDLSPAVIQVPDFGDRFWVYQVVDLRTDSFADLGKMYVDAGLVSVCWTKLAAIRSDVADIVPSLSCDRYIAISPPYSLRAASKNRR